MNKAISRLDKIEMIEINSPSVKMGREWYQIRIAVKNKRVFVTTALIRMWGNPKEIIFAQHPVNKKDWYIRPVEEGETGIRLRFTQGGSALCAGATFVRALQKSFDTNLIDNVTLTVSKTPEVINDIKYYPIITKAIENDTNRK